MIDTKKKIFISHSAADEALARKVSNALRKAGLEVWDDREILPGDNWAAKVAKGLEESNGMVVLLTPESLNSTWMRRDIEYALGEKRYSKRLIPVLVGTPEIIPEKNIPWILRHLHPVRLREPDKEEDRLNEIAKALAEDS